MNNGVSIPRLVLGDFSLTWPRLVATDLTYKAAAVVILAPLSAVILQILLRFSGQEALSDQDILYFALKPLGWVTLIVVGSIVVGIVAMELAALMLIGFGATDGREVGVVAALIATFKRSPGILILTARMVGLILLVGAPFLLVTGAIYYFLLTKHDINYYLAEKPPEFWTAVGLAAVVVAILLFLILRMVSGWFYAIQLLLFENVEASKALATSALRTVGHRWWIATWVVAWVAFGLVLSLVLTVPVLMLGRWLVPSFAGQLTLLVPILGLITLLWVVSNLAGSVITTALFGLLLVRLYRARGEESGRLPVDAIEAQEDREAVPRVTQKRLLWGALAAVAIAAVIGFLVLRSISFEDDSLITAHRGASGAAPENTMAAVEGAIAAGADFVEIDVQETVDGVVVVAHDSDFMKVSGSPAKVWEATAAELAELDIGSWFGPEFADQHVPTLAEVLDTCKGKIKVNIELKYYGHDQQLEQRVIDLVEERDMSKDIVIMSLKRQGVEKVQALRPDWTVGLLATMAMGDLTRLDVDFLAVNASTASPGFIRRAHANDKQVFAWTVNDVIGMSTQFSRGIDNLITDEPALAREVLAHRAEMSSVERLLVELAALFGMPGGGRQTEADA
jgi:glycerophosphoryl diester phosphodiesterase